MLLFSSIIFISEAPIIHGLQSKHKALLLQDIYSLSGSEGRGKKLNETTGLIGINTVTILSFTEVAK